MSKICICISPPSLTLCLSLSLSLSLSDLYVELQWDRPDIGVEVEEACGGTAQPLGHVLGIGDGGAESDHADRVFQMSGHVAHSGADDLQHRLQRKNTQGPVYIQ